MSAPRTQRPRRHGRRSGERGVALIIAVVAIAILTAVAVDFAYNSRVDLQLAANQRDELRAHYLARSGISMSRLLLRFQKQLDQIQLPNLGGLLGGAGGAGGGAGAIPGLPTGGSMNLQLWRMARIDCHMLQGMVSSDPDAPEEDDRAPSDEKFGFEDELGAATEGTELQKKSFGGFEGCFLAQISDEEEKFNLNTLERPGLGGQIAAGRALSLFGDKRYEFLWQKEDSNGVRTTPQELVVALRDWIDEDETGSSLNLSGQGTEAFLKGFSDENGNYSRYTPRYEAKNSRFDTLDELFLVHGVNDRFAAAFRDRLTVYPDINARLNINTDDPLMLWMAVLAVLPEQVVKSDPRIHNPVVQDDVIRRIRAARMFSFLGMSVADFVAVVESAGLPANPQIKNNPAANQFVSDKSQTFKIRSTGEAGQVQRTIEAVVRLDDGLGRLVYWREE